MHKEGMNANVTDRMEGAAMSVHTVHHKRVFHQHKQQITIRLRKVELVTSKFWK
jgi:hypothetical protein